MGNLGFLGGNNLGNHVAQFYHEKEDLFEAVVPFFREGLSEGAYCLWLVPGSLPVRSAWTALRGRMGEIDGFRKTRQFEILNAEKWYGRKDISSMLTQLQKKLEISQKKGFQKFRVVGGLSEVPKSRLRLFLEYEKRAHEILATAPGMAICTYSLKTLPIHHMEKVLRCHHQAFMRKGWSWKVLHSAHT